MRSCSKCCRELPDDEFNASHSWCKGCRRDWQAVYAKTPKGKEVQRRSSRKMRLRDWYGLTPAQYDQMVSDQGGICPICKRSGEKLCVDHDHQTGAVRGLLCSRCNRSLGQLGDTEQAVMSALTYLRTPPLSRRLTRSRIHDGEP